MADLPEDYPELEFKRRRFDRVNEMLGEWDDECLLADGFEEALVGVALPFSRGPVALYDYQEAIDILVATSTPNDDPEADPHTDAIDYMDFNVLGAWVGDKTPIFATIVGKEDLE